MGRQINFFFCKDDLERLINFIDGCNFVMTDVKGNILPKEGAASPEIRQFYFMVDVNRIRKTPGSVFVNGFESEAIEYSKGIGIEEGELKSSRIWAKFKYWNIANELVSKGDEFDRAYKAFVKWIKGNSKISICKGYYIGNHAYEQYKRGKIKAHLSTNRDGEKLYAEFM